MSDQAHDPAQWAIRVHRLSKAFPIYAAPHDRLKQFVLPRLPRWLRPSGQQYHRDFRALDEVDFQVARGETVGIIGRNGAGKSTLLQIICGTLTPSEGHVETTGRVAALLELGAGFNPEFSGHENVYLNGAVLGLSPEDIDRHYDEIVAFADIGQFLHQPVKTYSSGMFVRLAFAVQACVEPDILIVDEALSVGDIGFQYKCFKRMEALKQKGVTILMVTHSTGSVLEYADRCIVLDGGRVVQDTRDVLAAVLAYEKGMLGQEHAVASIPTYPDKAQPTMSVDTLRLRAAQDRNEDVGEKRFGSGRAIIKDMALLRANGSPLTEHPLIKPGEEIVFLFRVWAAETIPDVVLGVSVSGARGGDVWGDNNLNAGVPLCLVPGETVLEYRVRLPLSSGEYLIHCGLASLAQGEREELDQRRPLAKLRVWSARSQVGVVYAPVKVSVVGPEGVC